MDVNEDDADISSRVTVVLTTSPCCINPSTRLIEEVVASISSFAGGSKCRKLIVCDGVKVREENKFRSGKVTGEGLVRYEQYLSRLVHLTNDPTSSLFGAELLRLDTRHGFGHALKRGMMRVLTPYVLVAQHDRTFTRPVPMRQVVKIMDSDESVSYCGFATTTTINHDKKVKAYDLYPKRRRYEEDNLDLVPLVQWYDSMHIARTSYYLSCIYGQKRGCNLALGGFIEDAVGQFMLSEIRAKGMDAHAQFGTFIVEDSLNTPMAGHIDSHDPLNAGPRREYYMFLNSHTTEDDWSSRDVDPRAHFGIETLQGTGHWSDRQAYLLEQHTSSDTNSSP